MGRPKKIVLEYERLFPDANHRAVNAVWYLEPDVIEHMIFKGQLTQDILDNATYDRLGEPFPLSYLVKCCEYIRTLLSDHHRGLGERESRKLDKMIKLFKDKLGIDIDSFEVPFQNYCDYLFAWKSDETIEELTDHSMDELHAMGCRDIDLELFHESGRLNISRTKELLAEGADCDAVLPSPDYEDECSYYNIDREVHFMYTEVLGPGGTPQYDIFNLCQFDLYFSFAGYCAIMALFER